MKTFVLIFAGLIISGSGYSQKKKKRKKKDEVATIEAQMVQSKTILSKYVMSPIFIKSDSKEQNDLFEIAPKIEGYDVDDLGQRMDATELKKLQDHFYKWIINKSSTLDQTKRLEQTLNLKEFVSQKNPVSSDQAYFMTHHLGTYQKTSINMSADSTTKPDIWLNDNSLYRPVNYETAPSPTGIDEFGNPIYGPTDIDAYGNIILRQVKEYEEISMNQFNFLENWELKENGKIVKTIESISLLTSISPSIDHEGDWYQLFNVSSSKTKGNLLKKNVTYAVPFYQKNDDFSEFYYHELTATLLENAKNGKYNIYVDPSNKFDTDLSILNYSIEKGELQPSSWADLFSEDDNGDEFLVHKYVYDSLPMPIDHDGYEAYYSPEDLDDFGNPIVHHATAVEPLSFSDIAGIQFLEDWYLDPTSGQLSKQVTGFAFLMYMRSRDGDNIHSVSTKLGKTVFFKIK